MSDFIESVFSLDVEIFQEEMGRRFYDPLKKRFRRYVGLDGVTAVQYAHHSVRMIRTVQRQIISPSRNLDENGQPKTPTRFVYTPFQQFKVPKKSGSKETRTLSKGSIKNILAQKMISKFMSERLDSQFIDDSYAYRPGKSPKKALLKVQSLINQGDCHILDADIRKYFDNIDHEILMRKVRAVFPEEPELCHLIYRYIKTGWVETSDAKLDNKPLGKIRSPIQQDEQGQCIKGCYNKRLIGIPQGGILSGILANLYLNDFDHQLQVRFPNKPYIRYADDFLVFCKTAEECQEVKAYVGHYLKENLALDLHDGEKGKTRCLFIGEPRIHKTEPFVDFLGYRICRSKIKIHPKNMLAFKDKMKQILKKWEESDKLIGSLITQINLKIRGRLYEKDIQAGGSILIGRNWVGYFSLLTSHGQLKELDDWLAAEMLRAIRARKIPHQTRKILSKRGLQTLVALHYKMKREHTKQRKQREEQLKLPLMAT